MSKRCEIVYELRSASGMMSGGFAVQCCRTHHFEFRLDPLTSSAPLDICPLGRIEEATEKALERIGAAR